MMSAYIVVITSDLLSIVNAIFPSSSDGDIICTVALRVSSVVIFLFATSSSN